MLIFVGNIGICCKFQKDGSCTETEIRVIPKDPKDPGPIKVVQDKLDTTLETILPTIDPETLCVGELPGDATYVLAKAIYNGEAVCATDWEDPSIDEYMRRAVVATRSLLKKIVLASNPQQVFPVGWSKGGVC